jgi:hypothetical protein
MTRDVARRAGADTTPTIGFYEALPEPDGTIGLASGLTLMLGLGRRQGPAISRGRIKAQKRL